MCRYIMTEQFLGTTFVRLLSRDIHRINMVYLDEIEREVSQTIREKNNAVLNVSRHEIYSMVEEYEDFFELNDNDICINRNVEKRILYNNNEKNNFISRLESHFYFGMPQDIAETVEYTICKKIIGVK